MLTNKYSSWRLKFTKIVFLSELYKLRTCRATDDQALMSPDPNISIVPTYLSIHKVHIYA